MPSSHGRPENTELHGDDLPEVDLRTLLAEMAALKAEVRAQTQSAREARAESGKALDLLKLEFDRAAARESAWATRAAVDSERRRGALLLIDVADRLEVALASVSTPAPRGFFVRPDPRIGAFVEGLRLTMRRVDESLGRLGVKRVEARSRPFDPQLMEAVGTQWRTDQPEGVVLDEIAAGYVDERGPLRTAQVTVNARRGDEPRRKE